MDMSVQSSNASQNISRPTQRLKDSCDMCSASKVRCKREKPVCDRCAKLGYPCFYSPARRVGRPHGRRGRTNSTSQSSTPAPPGLHNSKPYDRIDYSKADTFQSRIPPQGSNEGGGTNNQQASSILNGAVGEAPTGSGDDMNLSGMFSGLDSSSSTDKPPNTPPFSERAESSSSSAPLCTSNGCELDCAGVAMGLQQQLEAVYESPALLATRDGGQMETRDADAAMGIASSALRQLSTILICPCSERLEVGLLVAAACNSILDAYEVIIKSSAVHPLSQSNMSAWTMTMVDDALHWNAMNLQENGSGDLSFDDFEEDILLVRVMGDLARMATVIIQFTKRYKGASGSVDSPDLLYAIGTHLRKRLQTIKDETTERL